MKFKRTNFGYFTQKLLVGFGRFRIVLYVLYMCIVYLYENGVLYPGCEVGEQGSLHEVARNRGQRHRLYNTTPAYYRPLPIEEG